MSFYFNPSFGDWGLLYYEDLSSTEYRYLGLNSGVVYEHRFGSERRIGLYSRLGIILVREYLSRYSRESFRDTLFDCRVGFQALLGENFSIAVEPGLVVEIDPDPWSFPLGKVAFTWAF